MQIQPLLTYQVFYEQVDLPDEFPIQNMFLNLLEFRSEPVTLMHFHNVLEIGYCYHGYGLFFIDGRVEPYCAGDVNVIFPGQVHVLQSDKQTPSQWGFIMLNPSTMLSELSIAELNLITTLYRNKNYPVSIFRQGDPNGISEMIRKIFLELGNQSAHYRPMLKSLVWALLLSLLRVQQTTEESEPTRLDNDLRKIAPALNYISEHYREDVKIADLARVCLMSPTHLRRLFSVTLGKSPAEYLYEVRIKMASLLLINTTSSVLDIALSVGYPTLSGFNRHFKKYMGVSPRKKRNLRE